MVSRRGIEGIGFRIVGHLQLVQFHVRRQGDPLQVGIRDFHDQSAGIPAPDAAEVLAERVHARFLEKGYIKVMPGSEATITFIYHSPIRTDLCNGWEHSLSWWRFWLYQFLLRRR